ncbi:unnamed protein product [Urochloa decumbens]|uniref:F-box domain-containing protein n=1 Tax=Urochloa decumbens TaxID=240449 RepID=A0ABC9HCP1_9POAL
MSLSKHGKKSIVQWCDIPVDPSTDVISRLDAIDILNFSATCRQWATICKNIDANFLKSGRPMLLTSQPDQDGTRYKDDVRTGKFGIHDVSKKLSLSCERVGLQRRYWIGGKDDWLVTTNTKFAVELLNPITGSTIPLPSLNKNQAGIKVNGCSRLHMCICPILSVTFDPFTCFIQRVVLTRTPSQHNGYEAIAIFSFGLLAYTSDGEDVWKVLRNPTDNDDGGFNYYPVDFHDAVNFNGRILAVDEGGSIFAWDHHSEDLSPVKLPAPDVQLDDDSKRKMFYLAISPTSRLMLVCLFGHGTGYINKSMRMLRKPTDRFEHMDGILIQEFDDEKAEWRHLPSIGHDQSMFLGLNYPFYRRSVDLEADSVYVADVVNNDVLIASLKKDSTVCITKQNFPINETHRVDNGYSVRTPMWFRPTDPVREKI